MGQAIYGRGKSAPVQVEGLIVYRVYLKERGFLAPYFRAHRWKELRRRGVRHCFFPAALRAEAARFGIVPLSVVPLRRALLPQLVGRGQCAALCADGVDSAVEKAALLLSRRYRYVSLDVGRGEQALSQMLYRRFGVGAGAFFAPEITVTFRAEAVAGPAVYLGERCEAYQSITYRIRSREDVPLSEELLCALFLAGKVKKEEICIKTISTNA